MVCMRDTVITRKTASIIVTVIKSGLENTAMEDLKAAKAEAVTSTESIIGH